VVEGVDDSLNPNKETYQILNASNASKKGTIQINVLKTHKVKKTYL